MVGKIFLNILFLYKWNGQLYEAVSPPQLGVFKQSDIAEGEKLR